MKQSMRRIGLVAGREFLAAVMNKGFVIGLLMMPAIIAILAVVFPRLVNRNVPAVRGEVAPQLVNSESTSAPPSAT